MKRGVIFTIIYFLAI